MLLRVLLSLLLVVLSNCISSGGSSDEPCVCGIEYSRTRIVSGEITKPYRFPWIVMIVNRDPRMGPDGVMCTGTIIAPKYVLTAHTCLPHSINPKNITVHTYQGCGYEELFKGPSYEAFRVMRQVDHFWPNSENDIGIIELKHPIPDRMPICVPTREYRDYNRSNLWVAGWGLTLGEDEELEKSECIRDVGVDAMPFWTCGIQFPTTNKRFCAGRYNGGICGIDVGGPIMCRNGTDGLAYVAGVSSLPGKHCGKIGDSASFERVQAHYSWIKANSKGVCFK